MESVMHIVSEQLACPGLHFIHLTLQMDRPSLSAFHIAFHMASQWSDDDKKTLKILKKTYVQHGTNW